MSRSPMRVASATYNRPRFIDDRVEMTQAWVDYLDSQQRAEVIGEVAVNSRSSGR